MASDSEYSVRSRLDKIVMDSDLKLVRFKLVGSSNVMEHSYSKVQKDFQKMTKAVEKASKDGRLEGLDNRQKLALYAWFKQATVGDNQGATPSFMNPKARAKHLAWKSVERRHPMHAMVEYIVSVIDAGLA
jgi:acyl-CoA-binding protein